MGIKQNARPVMVGPGLTLVHAALVRMVITPLNLALGSDQDTSSSGQ